MPLLQLFKFVLDLIEQSLELFEVHTGIRLLPAYH